MSEILKSGDYGYNTTFVKTSITIQTGGNIYNDVLILDDNKCVVISNDMICYYNSIEDYENSEQPTKFIERF